MYYLSGPYAWTQFAMGTRIPETSMRGFFTVEAWANAGSVLVLLRPPSAGTTKMKLQDTIPVSPKSQEFKLKAGAGYVDSSNIGMDSNGGWCATDDYQNVDIRSDAGGSRYFKVYVLGYEEFTDFGSGGPQW